MAWQITGDYFENCNCDVVCPCLFSPGEPLTSTPTQGHCDVAMAFHIDRGQYDGRSLDGLNVVAIATTPGPMGQGNWSLGLYVDERADGAQREALQQIFGGSAGGPMGTLAPLVSTILGVKTAPVTFTKEGKRRAVTVPGVMRMSVHAVPSMNPESEIWASAAHPFNLDKLALAVGDRESTFEDFGLRWDNSGKNGHYAEIRWSNP